VTIQIEKKLCGDCSRWELLTDEERAFMGILEYISVGRCTYGSTHMSEDNYECIFLNQKNAFKPIVEQ